MLLQPAFGDGHMCEGLGIWTPPPSLLHIWIFFFFGRGSRLLPLPYSSPRHEWYSLHSSPTTTTNSLMGYMSHIPGGFKTASTCCQICPGRGTALSNQKVSQFLHPRWWHGNNSSCEDLKEDNFGLLWLVSMFFINACTCWLLEGIIY